MGVCLPFVQVDVGFLAYQVRISASHALYLGERVHDLLLAVDIGVEESEDELEVGFFSRDERCSPHRLLVIA